MGPGYHGRVVASHLPRRAAAGWLVAIGLTALAGHFVLAQATIHTDFLAGVRPQLVGKHLDFLPLFNASSAFAHGRPAADWYRGGVDLGYAPPYAVLFGPIGALPVDVALGVAAVGGYLCTALALILWARASELPLRYAVILAVSVPAIQVFDIGQLMSGFGLLALTLAVLSQREDRWFVAGVALAFGFLRISNAVPVAVMLLVSALRSPRRLALLAAGGASIMAPLIAIAFVWDSRWPSDFLITTQAFHLSGPLRLLQLQFGSSAVGVVALLGAGLSAFLVRGDVGKPLSLDRAALVMAVSVPFANLAGWYTAVFALPAVLRVAARPRLRNIGWLATVVPWITIIILTPVLMGNSPEIVLNYLGTVGPIVLVAATYPLVRKRPELEMATENNSTPNAVV